MKIPYLPHRLLGVFQYTRGEDHRESCPRQYCSLSLRLDGEALFTSEGKEYRVTPKHLLFVPSQPHYAQHTQGETIIAIHFIPYGALSDQVTVLPLGDASLIRSSFQQLYCVWAEKKRGYETLAASLFYQILYLLDTVNRLTDDRETQVNTKIQAATDYIHQNFRTEVISIKALAKLSYLSETCFRQAFERVYSLSPNQYIRKLRLETAAQLLESGLYSVSEAAEKSGFRDVKYFSKEFHRAYGLSPRDYMKSQLSLPQR